MIIHFVEHSALLLSLCWLLTLNTRFWDRQDSTAKLSTGLLFGMTCVIGMMIAIKLDSGWVFDARSVILSIAALFGGPLVAGIAALLAGSYRIWLGGAGMWTGLSVIVMSVLLGLLYRHLQRQGRVGKGPGSLLVFGLLVHTLVLLLFFLPPVPNAASISWQAGVPMLLVMPVATVCLGWMLGDIRRRLRDERELQIAATAFETRQGLLVTDQHSRILRVNQAFSTITGYGADEVMGKNASLLGSGRMMRPFIRRCGNN
ncbi:LytS/YhcK type 5TM receptor domain-containing protein [Oceanisphaera psychrotolerans]|uniref:LytS/YhcK type 5TM receptor domain-containing protein n=1 Tax=Oceanisphaera psychrotolerans TaxID=1414654 RepID=UPI001C31375F|nr:LytS/YhcK type 5TM receptor domain-containing protein [Oceanisphaera psychrotolerans]